MILLEHTKSNENGLIPVSHPRFPVSVPRFRFAFRPVSPVSVSVSNENGLIPVSPPRFALIPVSPPFRPFRFPAIGDTIYHVINRANGRAIIFKDDKDYAHFESLLEEAKELLDMRILAYCIMPNHFHLVLYPRNDGDLSAAVALSELILQRVLRIC